MDRTERDWGFNFKLLVPPRVNMGQDYSKCFDKEQNMTFPNTTVVTPTKPSRQDFPKMKAVPPMEKDENNSSPGQLYSKLFGEVEKIKSWKFKVDSDIVQKERKLKENKTTIETQRKAIQELQDEAEMAFAKHNILKKACEATEKAKEDLKDKFSVTEVKVQELEAKLFTEIKKNKECSFEMEHLMNDLTQHKVKYEELMSNFNELQSEKHAIQQQFESGSSHVKAIKANLKVSEEKAVKLNRAIQRLEEENQSLKEEVNAIKTKIQKKCNEIEVVLQKKTKEDVIMATKQIINKVQKLRLTTAEAVKNKKDAELNCQHKIADMVALMEKHKNQYDRMVEEKDAELQENKKKDSEAVAYRKSLESGTESIRALCGTTPKDIHTKDLKTPRSVPICVGGSSKIRSYRIRTPPSDDKVTCRGNNTIELDPKSDSSEQNDLLVFANTPTLNFPAPHRKAIFKKLQSPVTHKSPCNSLKLAAMKRMRDAGWTAVTGYDKKKKKTNEKIFA
ncbi:Synaptonemal complex protein 1 [Channa argus]|uniref:Synaptonemal complex protein 1 n=1 Tax=Channa argus TaxID=215402 RepID=A0A6G1PIJ4_CHAAH|nr:Synaptonemal complex protein 1 [Channa argus]